MNEVAIPGKYQLYFKPDKRAIRKAEGASASNRSRPPKKVAAVKAPSRLQDSAKVAADLQQQTSAFDSKASSRARGFENVAWRALEQAYARNEFPHPYLRRDYLEITEVKLLPDRRTFQLWYRPKPHGRVNEDEIAEAMVKHTAAFKAMLMKHARPSTSSRLTFQFARMSDRHASMSDIWAQLEKEVQEQSEREAMERSEDEGLK
ncbi:MAG: hypothetical protein J3Q66DRAFT_367172 [Benniella sp.]|nr:MAG: hypothetical protein J3Q66DRAFT_367172 [Benniella sp.]